MPPSKGLSSPWETFASFHSLWFDRALTRNLLTTLRRVGLGFGLATLVGVPLGILCGCFTRVNAFFLPLTLFGRNIPVAALIPLTFSLFGIGELQKVMFIFIACVAFIVSDTARAIGEVRESYVDSAYTLGARRWQIIMKVLVPLAMPSVFNSLRLLFSLALGYIMLAEVIKFGGESGGLGDIINTSQRRGPREHVLLVLLIIPAVALLIDYMLLWIQQAALSLPLRRLGFVAQACAGRHARLGRRERLRMAAARSRRNSGRAEPEEPRDSSFGQSSLMTATDKKTVTGAESDGPIRGRGTGPRA